MVSKNSYTFTQTILLLLVLNFKESVFTFISSISLKQLFNENTVDSVVDDLF